MQAFHPDSKFMAAFNLFADIVIVNMLLVVTSLPVVTAGAALRAANVVVGDMVQGIGSRYGLAFIRQLTVEWKNVTVYWLGLLAAIALLVYQQFVVFQAGVTGITLIVIQGLALAGTFIIVGISVWFFALVSLLWSDTNETLTQIAGTAVQYTFRYLGYTVAAVAVLVAAAVITMKLPVALSIPMVVFLIPAIALFLVRLILALPLGQELGE
ncbi:hypothetical protein CJ203_05170 [Corynebacterium tuscaniense]|uniref:DUF624 domain-containing protein n=1 Tax=Corynebacterium tuscaniense TaxID=302449 RepID=A0A2N6T5T7_9CORY|nr:hypothetical protein [Corynebacterium tuscaniense]PMC64688.1 hypothetical protein CJ203_05170 [Corynebacterium tuscaniense]